MNIVRRNIPVPGYEEVIGFSCSEASLSGIVAIHNTQLGPACGGIRMLPYGSDEEALGDVLKLAKAMTYKSALADIGFGGGKSVIIFDPSQKTPLLLQAFGEAIDKLNGRYIAAKDMNVTSHDLLQVRKKTKHVLGIDGVEGSSGDPSPVTARGLLAALKATVEHLTGSQNLRGLRLAVQGLGHVGYAFSKLAYHLGVELFVTDISEDRVCQAVRELRAKPIDLRSIISVPCDVFAPCAGGGVLDARNISRLSCKAIVGAANNQLDSPNDGMLLFERGIIYVPDYAVNAGGIINIFVEFEGYDERKALKKADAIYDTIKIILERAKKERKPPFILADEMAEERLHDKA